MVPIEPNASTEQNVHESKIQEYARAGTARRDIYTCIPGTPSLPSVPSRPGSPTSPMPPLLPYDELHTLSLL